MYATLPAPGRPPFGGGEVGNMRTVHMLRGAGYRVVTVRQRKAAASWGRVRKLVSYPFRLAAGWAEVFARLLRAPRGSVAHLSGFAGKTILNEYVLMRLVRAMGLPVVYELRGGGAADFWERGGRLYRGMFRAILRSACHVFVQGRENIPLVRGLCRTPVYHYANCVEDGFAPDRLPEKPVGELGLLFYGRVEESKHVDMVVDAAALVQRRVPGTHLTVVGDGKRAYVDAVRERMARRLAPGTFECRAGCGHDELPGLLRSARFFVFPSTQPREGQSNAVTECMSYGVIPVASPQGFNRSTIGDDRLIVETLTAEAYAGRILDIIGTGQEASLSRQVYERFRRNFTQRIVFERTLAVYDEIMKGMDA